MNTRLLISLGAWLVLALLPVVLGLWQLSMFGQLFIYGIAAMALSFLWGEVGLVSFGQSLFFGAGAYIMALVGKGMVAGLPESAWLGLVLSVVGCATIGALTGAALFFGKGMRIVYFGIVTIAMAVIAERLATNWHYIGGFNGLLDVPPLPLPGGTDSGDPLAGYLVVLGIAAFSWLLLVALQRAPFGTVLRGIRCDERRMHSLGFSVAVYKLVALAISGGVTGLAGALFAAQFSFVSPAVIGLTMSIEILIWVAVGGKAVLLAAFLGALGVKWMESILSENIGHYWLLVIGIAFITVIVFFPQGLLGRLLDLGLSRRLRRN